MSQLTITAAVAVDPTSATCRHALARYYTKLQWRSCFTTALEPKEGTCYYSSGPAAPIATPSSPPRSSSPSSCPPPMARLVHGIAPPPSETPQTSCRRIRAEPSSTSPLVPLLPAIGTSCHLQLLTATPLSSRLHVRRAAETDLRHHRATVLLDDPRPPRPRRLVSRHRPRPWHLHQRERLLLDLRICSSSRGTILVSSSTTPEPRRNYSSPSSHLLQLRHPPPRRSFHLESPEPPSSRTPFAAAPPGCESRYLQPQAISAVVAVVRQDASKAPVPCASPSPRPEHHESHAVADLGEVLLLSKCCSRTA